MFISRSKELADEMKGGFVITADITDFYNQIYTHRINNLLSEASKGTLDEQAKIIEDFLLCLNIKTSRGIPVGPRPSIILSELIMGNIDKKIQEYTKKFVRYVDDIRMFFSTLEEAKFALHELTQYIYTYHRLVFSGEKTEILPTKDFAIRHLKDEKQQEKDTIKSKADEIAESKFDEIVGNLPPYSEDFDYEEEYEKVLNQVFEEDQLELLATTYLALFEKSMENPRDYGLIRHVLRQCTHYRIRVLVPLVLENLLNISPVIR